jgi:hypothetical protein
MEAPLVSYFPKSFLKLKLWLSLSNKGVLPATGMCNRMGQGDRVPQPSIHSLSLRISVPVNPIIMSRGAQLCFVVLLCKAKAFIYPV